jgi:hypothetical protein
MSHLLACKPTHCAAQSGTGTRAHGQGPTGQATAPPFRCAPLFRRGPLPGRSRFRHTREDTGPGRLSARRPPARAALVGFAPAPGQAALLPSRRLRADRLAIRPAANSDLPEIGTPVDPADAPNDSGTNPASTARHPQATASTSSRAPRLMQPLALGGHHSARARRHGRVRRLASPSACAGLLRRHRSGYRIARLRPTRDFARADKISSCRAAHGNSVGNKRQPSFPSLPRPARWPELGIQLCGVIAPRTESPIDEYSRVAKGTN